MNRFSFPLAALLALALASAPLAQGLGEGTPLYVGGQRLPIQVTTGAFYQHYEDDDVSLGQLALPVVAFVSVTEDVGVSLRASYAASEGDGLASLGGFTDAQAAVSYRHSFGAGSAVASLSANLPTGVGVETAEQARTAFFLGQGFYGFRMPALGQGFNVTPALTYAFPLNEQVALGVGASYQYRGAFEPLDFQDETYDPGDELLLTAGLDYRWTETAGLSLDATYVRYGEDEWGEAVFTTGDAFALTGQWFSALGAHEARVLGRIRSRGESTIPPETAALLGVDATILTQGRLAGFVRFDLGRRLYLGGLVQARGYASSEAFSSRTLLDAALMPEYALTPGLRLTGRLGATTGAFSGFDVGVGLAWRR